MSLFISVNVKAQHASFCAFRLVSIYVSMFTIVLKTTYLDIKYVYRVSLFFSSYNDLIVNVMNLKNFASNENNKRL